MKQSERDENLQQQMRRRKPTQTWFSRSLCECKNQMSEQLLFLAAIFVWVTEGSSLWNDYELSNQQQIEEAITNMTHKIRWVTAGGLMSCIQKSFSNSKQKKTVRYSPVTAKFSTQDSFLKTDSLLKIVRNHKKTSGENIILSQLVNLEIWGHFASRMSNQNIFNVKIWSWWFNTEVYTHLTLHFIKRGKREVDASLDQQVRQTSSSHQSR